MLLIQNQWSLCLRNLSKRIRTKSQSFWSVTKDWLMSQFGREWARAKTRSKTRLFAHKSRVISYFAEQHCCFNGCCCFFWWSTVCSYEVVRDESSKFFLCIGIVKQAYKLQIKFEKFLLVFPRKKNIFILLFFMMSTQNYDVNAWCQRWEIIVFKNNFISYSCKTLRYL